jgi:hypothetical protein
VSEKAHTSFFAECLFFREEQAPPLPAQMGDFIRCDIVIVGVCFLTTNDRLYFFENSPVVTPLPYPIGRGGACSSRKKTPMVTFVFWTVGDARPYKYNYFFQNHPKNFNSPSPQKFLVKGRGGKPFFQKGFPPHITLPNKSQIVV